jgi:hypothetical protein
MRHLSMFSTSKGQDKDKVLQSFAIEKAKAESPIFDFRVDFSLSQWRIDYILT